MTMENWDLHLRGAKRESPHIWCTSSFVPPLCPSNLIIIVVPKSLLEFSPQGTFGGQIKPKSTLLLCFWYTYVLCRCRYLVEAICSFDCGLSIEYFFHETLKKGLPNYRKYGWYAKGAPNKKLTSLKKTITHTNVNGRQS